MLNAADAPRRVIVVDDEEPGRVNLRYALAEHPRWQLTGEFGSAAAARAYLDENEVELILLDIHMPQESGLALARTLAQSAQSAQSAQLPLIVFVTAFDAHAIAAFDVHALDYLLKPIDEARLGAALARADAMLTQRQRAAHADAVRGYFLDADRAGQADGAAPFWTQINVRSIGCIERIVLDDVLWIAAAGNYVELHLAARTVLHRIPISRLEQHLDPRDFVRTHRRFIVRVDQCAALTGPLDGAYALGLRCGAAVPVSEHGLARVRACMATR